MKTIIKIGESEVTVYAEDCGDQDCAFWLCEASFAGRKFYGSGYTLDQAANKIKLKIENWLTSQCAALARIEIEEACFL